MANELFDLDDSYSVVRRAFSKYDSINLSNLGLSTYKISSGYEIQHNYISNENYKKDIANIVKNVIFEISDVDKRDEFYTAVYECVLNAYQHGNKKDFTKPVTIAHKIDDLVAKVLVIDQGGEFDSSFVPFVLRHKQGLYKEKFLDYYSFSGKYKNEENLGTGTSFIHTYVDSVKYFKSENGGLLVRLRKNL